MSPTILYVSLIFAGLLIFLSYWSKRQTANAIANFETLARFIEAPIIKNYFNLIIKITGIYQGRNVGWKYSLVQDEQRFTRFYMESKCELKNNFTYITQPSITPHVNLIGKRIYYIRELFDGKDIAIFLAQTMPLYSEFEIKDMLQELTSAAELLERRGAH